MADGEAGAPDRPWGPGESVCSACALHGRTCCECRQGEEGLLPPVSEAERGRMIRSAPWAVEKGLLVREPNSRPFIRRMVRLFPGQSAKACSAFPPDGWHYRLAADKKNRCVLLGSKGCLLPHLARPLFCRIFPFWFVQGRPEVFEFSDCLAMQTSETVRELCSLLGTTAEELTGLHREICRTWGFALSNRPPADWS